MKHRGRLKHRIVAPAANPCAVRVESPRRHWPGFLLRPRAFSFDGLSASIQALSSATMIALDASSRDGREACSRCGANCRRGRFAI
jgi:hypothetical protein